MFCGYQGAGRIMVTRSHAAIPISTVLVADFIQGLKGIAGFDISECWGWILDEILLASPGHTHQHVSLGNPGDLHWIKISENKIKFLGDQLRLGQRHFDTTPSCVNEIKRARGSTGIKCGHWWWRCQICIQRWMRLINDQWVEVTVKWLWLNKHSPCKNEDNHAVEDQSCKTQQRQNDSIDGLHHVNWTEPVRHIYLIAIVIWTSKRNWKKSNQINLSSSVLNHILF